MTMREPTLVFALRHGETAWNAEQRIQGQLDPPLNERGHRQARALAAALAGEGIDVIYSSDLARALQTAQALQLTTGAPLFTDAALRERGFGRFEGLTYAEIEQRWPDELARWRRRDAGFAPGGGEALAAFHARCVGAASALAERHPGQTIALVAHGGVLDGLYRAATGADLAAPRTWQLGNAAINRLLWHGTGFSLVGWNDEAHLLAPDPPGPPGP